MGIRILQGPFHQPIFWRGLDVRRKRRSHRPTDPTVGRAQLTRVHASQSSGSRIGVVIVRFTETFEIPWLVGGKYKIKAWLDMVNMHRRDKDDCKRAVTWRFELWYWLPIITFWVKRREIRTNSDQLLVIMQESGLEMTRAAALTLLSTLAHAIQMVGHMCRTCNLYCL